MAEETESTNRVGKGHPTQDRATAKAVRSAPVAIARSAAARPAVHDPAEVRAVPARAAGGASLLRRKKVCKFCVRENRSGQLQRRTAARAVRGRKRQDHAAAADRRMHAAPAPFVACDQAGAQYSIAAVRGTCAIVQDRRWSFVVSRSAVAAGWRFANDYRLTTSD